MNIESLKITDDGIEVIYRESSNQILLCNPPRPAPDRVWRETWEIRDGMLAKVASEEVKHMPAEGRSTWNFRENAEVSHDAERRCDH